MKTIMQRLTEIDRGKLKPHQLSALLDLQLELTTACSCTGYEVCEEEGLRRIDALLESFKSA